MAMGIRIPKKTKGWETKITYRFRDAYKGTDIRQLRPEVAVIDHLWP